MQPAPSWAFWAFLAALALLAPDILRPARWSFLDGVDLVFHEAGHLLFLPLNPTLYLLGGSLFQVLLPAALAGVFYWRGERVSAALVLLWTAQSLGSVSVYIADARRRELSLLGDDPDSHDWWQLLGQWHLLAQDTLLGRLVWLAGVGTALWAVWTAYRGTDFAGKARRWS